MRNWTAGGALVLVGILSAATVWGMRSPAPVHPPVIQAAQTPQNPTPTPDERPAALEFPEGAQWLNTDKPLTLKDLRGKVVLLDFWTYCCINCMHIIPDLKRLEEKYKNELVVVGVHSAKFNNEKESGNIRDAILRYEIEHPVINDRDFRVWRGYGINSWPTLVLIDPEGKVIGGKSGEGVYEPFNEVIGQTIKEFDAKGKIDRKPLKFALEKDRKPASTLAFPGKIAADETGGRLFISDSNHNRLVVAGLTGTILATVGSGTQGLKDGTFTTAQFNRPQGIAYDAAKERLFVADTENHAIRLVDLKAKTVTTLAGTGKQARAYPPVGGAGRMTELSSPWDVVLIGDTLYIAMAGTHQLWTLDTRTLAADPFAGTGGENLKDGPVQAALLAQPSGLTTDGSRLYFADSEVSAVRTADLTPTGKVNTLIGQGLFEFGDVDGKFPTARLQHPLGVAYYKGYIYVADAYNHKIKRVNPRTRTLETVIGTGKRGTADGTAKKASLNEPNGLTFVHGKMYITDTNNSRIRAYDPATDMVTTLNVGGQAKLAPIVPKNIAAPFFGTTTTLASQEISADAKTLEVTIKLPEGTKFNQKAPFALKVTSDKPDSVTVGKATLTKPSSFLTIPIQPKMGGATLTIEVSVNYCTIADEGQCYFKEARLKVPLRVAASGKDRAAVTYTP